MEISRVPLHGRTVTLLPLHPVHRDLLHEAGKPEEIWTHTRMRIRSEADADDFILQALQQQDAIAYLILDRESGRAAGSTRIYDISTENLSAEIGYTWIAPDYWRTSVNTECKFLMLRHCFEQLGLIRVQLKTDVRNARSRQAIERIGAVQEGILRNHLRMPDGRVRDTVFYSILNREWPRVKAGLQERLGGGLMQLTTQETIWP